MVHCLSDLNDAAGIEEVCMTGVIVNLNAGNLVSG